MKDLRDKLHKMHWLEARAEKLEEPYGRHKGSPKLARARAAKAHKPLQQYFTSAHVLIADIDILLDVIETITCQGGDVKILRDLVLEAFRTLKEGQ